VVWTFWRRRDEVLSWSLLMTAVFLFTPYSYCYDMVVLAWVAAVLRQRTDNSAIDHCLILAVWVLPVAMMLLGVTLHVPPGIVVLPMFAARLLWRLARTPGTIESSIRRNAPAQFAQSGA
jgi:alpha-1,2-mannosyltransferase